MGGWEGGWRDRCVGEKVHKRNEKETVFASTLPRMTVFIFQWEDRSSTSMSVIPTGRRHTVFVRTGQSRKEIINRN